MATHLSWRPALAAAICLALVGACSAPPPRPTFPDIRFTGEPPLLLNVATVDVRNDYQMPFRPPNVEHLFPVQPAHAAENWARDRLKADGASGRALFIIRDASATETELPVTGGIQGAFTTQPSERYDLKLSATLQIIDSTGQAVRNVTATATRSQSVLQGITPNDRDRAWYDMTKALLGDFDQQMTAEMHNNLGTYLER